MSLSIIQMSLGPLQTNCYVMACTETGQAAIVDPAWDARAIVRAAQEVLAGPSATSC